MDQTAVHEAASALARAWQTGVPIDRLPAQPQTVAEAVAIQTEVARLANESSVGWKVSLTADHGVLHALLLRSRTFADGATVATGRMAMVGVEAEVAFRFDAPVPPRDRPYEAAEIAALVTAVPVIETLDTRFSAAATPSALDKAADFMSNGTFIVGTPVADWRGIDLVDIGVRVIVDGVEKISKTGGHASGSPLEPAVALANLLRDGSGVPAGAIVTTGSYTGTLSVAKSAKVEIAFEGFGRVGCTFSDVSPA